MFGISYGELFLLLGATAALIGPKDLPKIARTAGRLAGRAIGYVQMARGQFDSVLQQSQVSQVHKELQDAMAQLEAIRYEVRSLSIMNPGPMTRRIMESGEVAPSSDGTIMINSVVGSLNGGVQEIDKEVKITDAVSKVKDKNAVNLGNLHSQAAAFARLCDSSATKTAASAESVERIDNGSGSVAVLPVSALSAGLLPKGGNETVGSDILLEAIVEAEVAGNAKHFFAHPENQIPSE